MNYYKKLYSLFFFFNYFMLTFIYSTSETLYANQISVFSFDMLNKYLIFISFIIFITSFYSMKFMLEGKMIFLSLFFFSYFLFSTNNLLLFFMMLESVLFPMIYFFVYYSEYKNRYISLSYMFIMTLIFSSPFLMFIILNLKNSSEMYMKFVMTLNSFFFFLIILSFLMKLPVYGLHYWLPKAHVDAPVAGSMVLASIMLKYSSYSLARVMFFLSYFSMSYMFMLFLIFLGSLSYFFMSYICVQILDLKVLIAFSSVSHMSFAMLGAINSNFLSMKSSYLMYISHSMISPLMFFMSYLLYLMMNTRLLNSIYSLSKYTIFKNLLVLILLMNLSFPPFMNFFSEIYIFSSCYIYYFLLIFFFFLGFFFNSLYHIKLMTMLLNKNFFLKMKIKLSIKYLYINFMLMYYFMLLSMFLYYY